MREITSHKAGKILIAIVAISSICYVFVVPFVLQGKDFLLFGWMPLAVFFWNVQTLLWAITFWVYTSKHWPYR